MAKQHYFFKLIPPRPTFMQDMNDEEKRLMDEHGRYFQEHFAAGKVLLFGPVMASGGAFGLGILEVDNEQEARGFGEGDPSVRAGLNKFEIHPMRVSAARAQRTVKVFSTISGWVLRQRRRYEAQHEAQRHRQELRTGDRDSIPVPLPDDCQPLR